MLNLLAAAPNICAAATAVVTSRSGQQNTPLSAAAASGSDQAAKFLLDLVPETAMIRLAPFGFLPIHWGEAGLCLVAWWTGCPVALLASTFSDDCLL